MREEILCKECNGTGIVSLGEGVRGIRVCNKCDGLGSYDKREVGSVINVGFKRLTKDAIIPTKAHESDSGFDLYANEDVTIRPNETKVISTGIAVQLPVGCEAQVRPRSGVTSKTKLRVQLGTIDNDYVGDIGIIVDNIAVNKKERMAGHMGVDENCKLRHVDGSFSDLGTMNNDYVYKVRKGDRIAQLVVQFLPKTEGVEVDNLDETERGGKGFGSSGV